jgi:opacity protein-like surface antigen
MMSRRCLALMVLAALVVVPVQASAEWFVDLYAGYTWTQRSDLGVTTFSNSGVETHQTLVDVKFDKSPIGGVRGGYWFGFAPFFGIGVDAFHFRPDIPTQQVFARGSSVPQTFNQEDVPAVVAGLDLLLRWPLLASPDFPNGRLQPYFSAGPSVLITDPDDFGTSVGFKLGAGVAWQLSRHFAVFTEYRFTRYTPDVDTGNVRYEADLNTHHVVGGISFRF